MNTALEQILVKAKDTVGYAEAANKQTFTDGCSVGIVKAGEYFLNQIDQLETSLKLTNEELEIVRNDMHTLINIITKYKSKEL